jgi:integrase
MKTKFYLRKGIKKSTINFEFRNGTKIKFRASTGFTINSQKDWDSVRQKMKLPSSTSNATLINSKLSEFDNLLTSLYFHASEDKITLESIREIFNKVFDVSGTSASRFQNDYFKEDVEEILNKDFITYYDWFLVFYSMNNSPYSKRILTTGTLKTFKNTLSTLKKYLKERNLKTLYFDDFNRKFYNDFISYLTQKGYSKNYTGTMIQKVKTVMGYALDEGKHTNLEFKKSYFSKVSEVINHPYLEIEELKRIEELTLNCDESTTARDIFLIACYTGLRIGDMLSLIKNPTFVNQNGKQFIKVIQSKTSNPVFIPLNHVIRDIMDRNNGQLPSYQNSHKINLHLKSICKKAKIDSNYQYSRTEGGKKVIYEEPKYKFITTHTARRSFCTNAYNQGMLIQDIMAISGHKTEKVFLNYIKVDLLQNASRISEHEFFR